MHIFNRRDVLETRQNNSLLRRGFCFLKTAEKRERRKKGKGGKTGKAEKAREKGKSEESLCQISVEIWRPSGGWLCTAMPACWVVEQRILKMAFLNFNKTPAKAFTPPAEKKIGTRWSFVEKVNE